MSSTKGPAKGTRVQDGRYYLVRADGKKRIWIPLSRVTDGLPAFYARLAEELKAPTVADDVLPKVIAAWEAEVMVGHAEQTQRDERARGRVIAERLAEFRAKDLEPSDCDEFLRDYEAKPRTYNAFRGQLGELMRFAIRKGWRPAGTNPVRGVIPTKATPARSRCPTDSEVRRIKIAGIYGADGKRTRSGLLLAALIDMAYLTGQRIGDLLALEWSAIGKDGIYFRPEKTKGTTGASVMIGWTPRLENVVARLRQLRVERRAFGPSVFTTQAGNLISYWGASSAWRRACQRAGVVDCHFHDLRAKALTDTEEAEGMQAARRKGSHSTEQQTTDYLRNKKPQRVKATR